MANNRMFALSLALLLVVSPILMSGSSEGAMNPCGEVGKKTVVEKDPKIDSYIKYTFQYNSQKKRYCVLVENEAEYGTPGTFSASVDDTSAEVDMPYVESGESKFVTKNISEYLNVKRDTHQVELGVYGQSFVYNFTEKLNATSPDVPAPTISDVDVVRYEKNDSTALRVAVRNPAKRGYSLYVQAKTYGTKRVDDIGAPQPNETSVFTLPLDEGSDAVVAGKVRVFDTWGDPETKFDQREFLARPGDDTADWHKSFEHMPGTDSRQSYHNESTQQHRAGYVDDDYLSPTQRKIGAVLTVVLLVGAVWWRRRRKFR